jgi:hypothetical protein
MLSDRVSAASFKWCVQKRNAVVIPGAEHMCVHNTPVIAVVSEHWLVGVLPLTGARIRDVLRDGNTDFVHVHNVSVYQNGESESRVAILPQALVPKEKIQLVIIPKSRHEAPVRRYNNLAKSATANVFLMVGGYSVQGELHLPTLSKNMLHTFTSGIGEFFAITQARVEGFGKRLSAPVVLANKGLVGCFSLGELGNTENTSVGVPQSRQPREVDSAENNLLEQLEEVLGLGACRREIEPCKAVECAQMVGN